MAIARDGDCLLLTNAYDRRVIRLDVHGDYRLVFVRRRVWWDGYVSPDRTCVFNNAAPIGPDRIVSIVLEPPEHIQRALDEARQQGDASHGQDR